ncbi:MAG: serine--tRNA ligase [Alphaproteobacteria bacterium]|nr:serine--tRNA ligase [Alphaproteobacteria bacterium]
MHDLKFIRDNPDAFDAGLKARGLDPLSAEILDLDRRRRAAQTEMQELQSRRNAASRDIGAKKKAGEDADALVAEVQRIKQRLVELEGEEADCGETLEAHLVGLPNLPFEDVPVGPDESANEETRRVGAPRAYDFEPKQHFEIGEALGLMDFETAARMSGARFVLLKGALARMERALANFMLDVHTSENGYSETIPPFLVRDNALFGTGQLPKFAEDLFRTTSEHWLIPTAEVPLTNIGAETVWEETDLPMRFTAWTPCFRSEAGAAGRDTRGMIRQHQFSKVEMVSIVHPDRSAEELERMTACAEGILKRLDLPFRTVVLSTGDMGFGARKTHDIEVWLPGQGQYREISSCSNCGDFQARRMKARFKTPGEKGTRFVHTLNGSGLAVGRTLIAVLETYQEADGAVAIPDALKPYMGGLTRIEAPK